MISYLAALLAAVSNATREAPGRGQFRLQLISDLPHRKAWLAAISPAGPRERRDEPVKAAGYR